jgi:hypothetical protein
MPIFQITTVNSFRNRYVVEANSIEQAYNAISNNCPEELSQIHLGEHFIDGRKISNFEFRNLLDQVKNESQEYGGLDNSHMGKKIIYRVEFIDA